MQAALRAGRKAAQPVFQQVRRMSGGSINVEQEAKEARKWKIISIAALPVIAGMTVVNFSHHPHFEKNPPYPYLHIRNKEFPWGPNGLFETESHHE